MRILLVEDDELTSELLSAELVAHRYAVDAVADGAIGFDLATQWTYDLILLDVLLPTLSGIEVCRRLRAQDCKTPILMLTTKDSNADVIAGLDAGADDYVAKSCDPSQLLARVRALLRRSGTVATSPVLTWEHLCLDPASAQVTYQHESIALRPKEYSLLELFLRHPQRVFSRSAVIDHLWSMDDTPVEGSVTNLIKDLRHRLKSAGMKTDLIETVYGLGYRLKTAPLEEREPGRRGDGERREMIPVATSTVDGRTDRETRSPQGKAAIQQISERFQLSLEQRIVELELAQRSLQAGDLSSEQQQLAFTQAHKLAGGLGTFGYGKATEVAHTLEQLLAAEISQDDLAAKQFAQLLQELKHAIATPIEQTVR